MLDVLARRALLDDCPAHAARKVDALALDVGAGLAPELQRLGIILEVDADLLEHGFGVVLDERQPLLAEHLVIGDLARDEGHRLDRVSKPRGTLRVAPGTAP